MTKKLAAVTYRKNDASIECHQIENAPGVPAEDSISLLFRRKKKRTLMYMRPDEAMAVIRVLSLGLHAMVTGYEFTALTKRKGTCR